MTTIECIGSPFTYRWPQGEVRLVPGHPIELPDDRAARLLQRAPGKVKVVVPTTAPRFTEGSPVLVRSLSREPWCALVAFMLPQPPGGTTKAGWWYCVEAGARWSFVHESLLDDGREP